MYTCRDCERLINPATEVCPYCGTDLTADAAPRSEEPGRKRSRVAMLLRWSVVLAALWGFLWYVLPERGDPGARAEARALELMQQAGAALRSFAEAQGSFPASLDALPGDSRSGVRQAAQAALSEGYRLEYAPGPPSPVGRVTSFSLRARAGKHGYRNFFADETGVLRSTRENRPATPEDPILLSR